MNKERVSSAKVVTALKQEAYRRKSCKDNSNILTIASSAKTPKPPVKDKNQPLQSQYCTFCEKEGHTLTNCQRTGRVPRKHKSKQQASGGSCVAGLAATNDIKSKPISGRACVNSTPSLPDELLV
ncbi:hypothetical protein PCASD_22211 [Puccinia coronata f. sp. avenae]|uniref:CCHC-type domain-containing protein n=1 Tax=Puccinia coronata f. sp. avenae TaxID=200324 RepID=A0A2N5T7S2_9BASI|nr:hypothetical protein PCASD_22211 [Puccinia coronata f. sp. avenae]